MDQTRRYVLTLVANGFNSFDALGFFLSTAGARSFDYSVDGDGFFTSLERRVMVAVKGRVVVRNPTAVPITVSILTSSNPSADFRNSADTGIPEPIEGAIAEGQPANGVPVTVAGRGPTGNVQTLSVGASGAARVEGGAAIGAAPAGNPVPAGVRNAAGNLDLLNLDATGNLRATIASDQNNVAPASAAVLGVAGWDSVTMRRLLTDALGKLRVASDGIVGAGNPAFTEQMGGTDGVLLRALLLDTLGRMRLATDGAPAAAVPALLQQIGGTDGALLRALLLDATGRARLATDGTTGVAVPALAQLLGGSDGTLLRALLLDATGRMRLATDGTAAVAVPALAQLIAGIDAGGLLRRLFTDTTGRANVVGASAEAAAVAGNPLLFALQDAGNLVRALRGDSRGYAHLASAPLDEYNTIHRVAADATSSNSGVIRSSATKRVRLRKIYWVDPPAYAVATRTAIEVLSFATATLNSNVATSINQTRRQSPAATALADDFNATGGLSPSTGQLFHASFPFWAVPAGDARQPKPGDVLYDSTAAHAVPIEIPVSALLLHRCIISTTWTVRPSLALVWEELT